MHMPHRLDAGKFSRSALRRLQTLARVEIPDRLRRYRAEYAHGAGSVQVFRGRFSGCRAPLHTKH